ncbi:MAG: hypothetical protein AAB215_05360, partial [Planctomycetota bacterium]
VTHIKGNPDVWGAGRRHCVSHWGEDAGYYGCSHTWVRGFLDAYKIAGLRRGLDVARAGAEFGWHVVMKGKKEWPGGGRTEELKDREFCLPFLSQVCLWETTGEAVYKQRADDVVKNVYLKYQHPDGAWISRFTWGERKVGETSKSSFASSPGGWSVYYANPAMILYHELTGDPAVAKGLVRNDDFLFKRQDHLHLALQTWAFAYEQTKNTKYTDSGKASFAKQFKSGGKIPRSNYTQESLLKAISIDLAGSNGIRELNRFLVLSPEMMKAVAAAGGGK